MVSVVVAGKVKRYTPEELQDKLSELLPAFENYNITKVTKHTTFTTTQTTLCQKCCHNIRVFMGNFEDRYSDVYKQTESSSGYPSYVSTSTSKAVWYSEEGAWVIGSYSDGSVYAKLESHNECPDMVDSNNPTWLVYNSVTNEWQPDYEIKIECIQRVLLAPYFTLTASEPVRYGGNFLGLYHAMDNILINENSVYKHSYLELYVQVFKNRIRFGISLDLNKEGWNLEFNSDDLTMYVWNGTDFVPDPLFKVNELTQIPEEDPVVNDVPCKLQMSSDGPLGRLFPDQMGVYKLIEGLLVYNKPIWKHVSKPFYIRVDDGGSWFVTSVSWLRCLFFWPLSFLFYLFSAKKPVPMAILENYITMGFNLPI